MPPVPSLLGLSRGLDLYDTATGTVRPTEPGPVARMYVCGITPYDATHMGHAATYVAFDIVQRVWLDAGHDVHYVQNVTDIDDPLLERAVATGQDWRVIADRETALFREDMSALNVIPPRDYLGAVESIPSVARYVEDLQVKGAIYAVDDDLYFSVNADPRFGTVTNLNEAQMIAEFAERGGDPDRPGKRHPLDCLVWQDARPDEPAWDTPLGHGRPGWHSDCVVMRLDLLGEGFDLHCGGADLRFPHHENERAQAVALGKTFANHWMHNGFVVDIEGEKMSKSLGNVLNLIDLLEKYDPRAYRMLLLQTHYRSPTRVGEENIDACVSALAGLDSFAARTSVHSNGTPDPTVMNQFTTAMDNDLDTTTVMALVFDSVRRANTAMDSGDIATVASVRAAVIEILGALGLELSLGDDIDADIVAKGEALDAARKAKDFVTADALRDELQSLGYVVETSKDGTRIRRG